MTTQSTNQELFERIRLLVIQHGSKEDVDALHELRERFNLLAAPPSPPRPDQIDRAAQQLFALDNPASRWPTVNQEQYRREAKAILDAALPRS